MKEIIFISGIDTDAGKTYTTGFLAKNYIQEGKKVVTLKFIQTGCEDTSEDILIHRKITGTPIPEDEEGLTAPIIFRYPASAQLAAKLEDKDINLEKIDQAILKLEKNYDVILIEGAGGLMVPITDNFLTIDYPLTRQLPVILVTNGILGSINHTILSLEAIRNRDMTLHSVAYNKFFDTDKIIAEDTYNFIKRYLSKHFPKIPLIDVPAISNI